MAIPDMLEIPKVCQRQFSTEADWVISKVLLKCPLEVLAQPVVPAM